MNEKIRPQHDSAVRIAVSPELPIATNEDVQYSTEFADENDVEAVERAHEADDRQQQE